MSDPAAIAQAYLATWNEADATRRASLMKQHWSEDAVYADPLMGAQGAGQISGLVAAVHERFPGFRFKPLGTPNGHGKFVRLAWTLGPEVGEAPIEGSDVVVVEAGRIREVIGFIDRAPG